MSVALLAEKLEHAACLACGDALRNQIEMQAACIEAIAEQLGLPEDASRDDIQDRIDDLRRNQR